ncbi:hypothetical protein AaE_007090, partial [Aphanomyces astaci]
GMMQLPSPDVGDSKTKINRDQEGYAATVSFASSANIIDLADSSDPSEPPTPEIVDLTEAALGDEFEQRENVSAKQKQTDLDNDRLPRRLSCSGNQALRDAGLSTPQALDEVRMHPSRRYLSDYPRELVHGMGHGNRNIESKKRTEVSESGSTHIWNDDPQSAPDYAPLSLKPSKPSLSTSFQALLTGEGHQFEENSATQSTRCDGRELFDKIRAAYLHLNSSSAPTRTKPKRILKPEQHRYPPSHFVEPHETVMHSGDACSTFGETHFAWPKTFQELKSLSFVHGGRSKKLDEVRAHLAQLFPVEKSTSSALLLHPWDDTPSSSPASTLAPCKGGVLSSSWREIHMNLR